MPDATTYIHPIIQAMVDSANLKSKAISQQNQSDQAKEEAKLRRDQLAETVKRATEEHDLNVQHLNLARDQYALQQQQFMHLAKHGVLEDIASGIQSPDTLPSAPTIPTALNSQPGNPTGIVTPNPASVQPTPNFSQMPPPGPSDSETGNVDVAGTSMPRAAVAQIPQNVAAQAARISEAKAGPQIAREKMIEDARAAREIANEKQRHADAQAQLTMQEKFLGHQKDLDRQNHLDVMNARIAGVQHGVDPEDVQSLMEDASTGNADLTGSTRPVLAARTAMQGAGRKPFGAKEAASLKASVGLQDWIDQLRDFANKNLATSKVGAAVSGIVNKNPLYKTDAANQYDAIQTGLITAGKALEGISGGRITIPQMQKLESGASGLNITKDQANKLADNLQSRLHQQVDTNLLGGIGETQRQLIFHAQGVTPERLGLTGSHSTNLNLPDFLKIAPKTNKRGTAINVNESIKAGQPVYGGQ
jgi:hypothetical protein